VKYFPFLLVLLVFLMGCGLFTPRPMQTVEKYLPSPAPNIRVVVPKAPPTVGSLVGDLSFSKIISAGLLAVGCLIFLFAGSDGPKEFRARLILYIFSGLCLGGVMFILLFRS